MEPDSRIRNLNYILGEIDGLYHEAACRLELSDSVLTTLYALCVNGGSCLLSDIYKLTGICKQTINSAIRKLENEKIVYLENCNGRAKTVLLTDTGRAYAAHTAFALIEVENKVFAGWSDEDIESYLSLNKKYAADFKEQLKQINLGGNK